MGFRRTNTISHCCANLLLTHSHKCEKLAGLQESTHNMAWHIKPEINCLFFQQPSVINIKVIAVIRNLPKADCIDAFLQKIKRACETYSLEQENKNLLTYTSYAETMGE